MNSHVIQVCHHDWNILILQFRSLFLNPDLGLITVQIQQKDYSLVILLRNLFSPDIILIVTVHFAITGSVATSASSRRIASTVYDLR